MNDVITVKGKIIDVLPNTLFRVEVIESNDLPEIIGRMIMCTISGKMRRHYIRLMAGDMVQAEMTPKYDLDRGRITFRLK